jgi:hypothetical protein
MYRLRNLPGKAEISVKDDRTESTGRKLFSPVVNRAALMTILALAVAKKMLVFICDVKRGFSLC